MGLLDGSLEGFGEVMGVWVWAGAPCLHAHVHVPVNPALPEGGKPRFVALSGACGGNVYKGPKAYAMGAYAICPMLSLTWC